MRLIFSILTALNVGLLAPSIQAALTQKLLIISPHRKSIQREFIKVFREHHLNTYGEGVEVDWVDQGGTENDLRYIKAKYSKNSLTSDLDVFWGGGDISFHELDELDYLAPYDPESRLGFAMPKTLSGMSLRSFKGTWHASAISSFGVFFNKHLTKYLNIREPLVWGDLADPVYLDLVSIADPRHSSSALMMYLVILCSSTWEKAWVSLSQMAANTRKFSYSSSDPIKAVVSGDAVAATAIDFYAYAKIAQLGKANLGFVMPENQTILNLDPIAVLKGAPNPIVARRFLDFVLSRQGQRLYILPEGHQEGPQWSTLGRMAINPMAYQGQAGADAVVANPYEMRSLALGLSLDKMTDLKQVLRDLLGAVYCDAHRDLRLAWKHILKMKGEKSLALQKLNYGPASEKELLQHAKHWGDRAYRSRVSLAWLNEAKARYRSILSL